MGSASSKAAGNSTGWQVLHDYVVPADVASLSFDGLQGNNNDIIRIIISAEMKGTGAPFITLNGDTGNNYNTLNVKYFDDPAGTPVDVSVDEVTSNNGILLIRDTETFTSGVQIYSEINIAAVSGRTAGHVVMTETHTTSTGGSGYQIHRNTGDYTDTGEITSIQLLGDAPFAALFRWGAGSRIQIQGMSSR